MAYLIVSLNTNNKSSSSSSSSGEPEDAELMKDVFAHIFFSAQISLEFKSSFVEWET
jgi:hypothetical protein